MIGRILIFIAMIVMGGYMAYNQLTRGRHCTQAVTATVVGRETKRVRGRRGRRTTHYAPVVEFMAGDQTIRATADVDSIFAGKYKDGDALQIRYNPDDPEEIVVQGKSFRSGVLGGCFVSLVGIVGLVMILLKK